MQLGYRGSELIKSYETLRLKAYLPTPQDRPTIGWGHTRGVKMGQEIDAIRAEQFFRADVLAAEQMVNRLGVPLTQAMFDALVSLAFNAGELGETITGHLQARRYYEACEFMFRWRNQAKQVKLGLARRRAREMQLYLEDGIPQ
jgi:lysozyme